MKNSFSPINRIPPGLFLLILKHWGKHDIDKNTITLTHVCRGWRDVLIADPSLWTHLDCTNVEKTRVYIERSKSSHLEISLRKSENATYLEDAFLLVVPHIGRFGSLTIVGTEDLLQNLTQHISCSAPLLKELTINIECGTYPILDITLFDGDLSLLRTLSLTGVGTHLPWRNLSNLTAFHLQYTPDDQLSITQFLDFFENAHRLRDVTLTHSTVASSDAPPERVISLPRLKNLTINAAPPQHSIILNHLIIPARARVTLKFYVFSSGPLFRHFLPKELGNLNNICPIASVNLDFNGVEGSVQLKGPIGRLYMFGLWKGPARPKRDSDVFKSLDHFTLSGARTLGVTWFKASTVAEIENSAPYGVLFRMEALRTLTLAQCDNLPFILALNPDQTPSKNILCPELEEIVLHIEDRESFNIPELMAMAKERASRGMKLASITIVGLGELLPGREVFRLREYVAKVDYKVGEGPPEWDAVLKDEHDR